MADHATASREVRKIIHLDMDCFYAAVEMRERPELAGRPVAVGGGSRRGVICTCNYAAREYGVRSAMPGFQARELCPELIFLPVRFDLYRRESEKIREILRSVTPLVEPLSLDEAYLDVSALDRYAWDVAKEIREKIYATTGLTASAGVAPNKLLAKIASDWRKPNGQFAIPPDKVEDFLKGLPVRKLWGVGPRAVERLADMGVSTCGDLQRLSEWDLCREFGKWGSELFHLCRGIDHRSVEPFRPRKSLSTERTFSENLQRPQDLQQVLLEQVEELMETYRKKKIQDPIRSVFVKIKFADFQQRIREKGGMEPTTELFCSLLESGLDGAQKPVRLLGAGLRFQVEGANLPKQVEFPFDEEPEGQPPATQIP